VIANTSSGKRFGPLATYLVSGRSGAETDRVAWTAGRNLGTDDPELAAPLMQATARQSALVQVPVYHLTVSFDQQDRVTPEQMQRVADRVLHDLGLSNHQALMVAHKDREHAHVHVMINRVHPDTGVAWERWQDRPKIDVAAAGGWKDTETLLTCYQQADTQTLLAVMAEERKVHEHHIARAANG
jgi:hypothetical protein